MFLKPSESWCHGRRTISWELWLWGRRATPEAKCRRREGWGEVLGVSLFPSANLLLPAAIGHAAKMPGWCIPQVSGQRQAEEDGEQNMNGKGGGGMKIVYSLNKYFFNWLLCSRHWAKCTWHVKLCLGFASRSVGHRSRGNFFLLEYYFYLQHFNRDSSVWIRLQWGLLPFASVCHST